MHSFRVYAFCLSVCIQLPACAPRAQHDEMSTSHAPGVVDLANTGELTSALSRVECMGLVATIESLKLKDGSVGVSYQVQQLQSCSWLLKPQASGVVQFYDSDKRLLDGGTRVSVRLNFERFQHGLPSQMEFIVPIPKDAYFITVWYGVDEFETNLCPLPRPKV